MSKTLHPFGRVLFDELEQIAIRRGGFASLVSVKQDLVEARKRLDQLKEDAANPDIAVEPSRGPAEDVDRLIPHP